MKGAPNAVVTIEEFADFQCPQCANVYKTMNSIHAAYGSRIKFIYRNFPLTQIHQNSYDAAVAAEAAYLQDANKFWDMQNQLFTNQAAWSNLPDPRPTFRDYASKIGLDIAKWENDVAGMLAKSRVDADIQRGRALNITGTPSIYINGQLVQGFSFEIIKQVIDAELQKGAPANQNPPPAQPANAANTSSNK
jgi:protein-disulfide isomerase